MPSGRKNRPSRPWRKSSGTKTTTMRSVANTTDARISLLASKMTCTRGRRSASGSAPFSRRRRKMFSTSMIASSTSSPIATASPPSVMTLIERSKAQRVRSEAASESGSAVSVMTVARTSSRNRMRMRRTMMLASRSTVTTLVTDRWMKSACRKTARFSSIPGGRPSLTSSRTRSISWVRPSVFVPGDFWTLRTTAERPPSAAVPRIGAAPSSTSATCPIVTGAPSR